MCLQLTLGVYFFGLVFDPFSNGFYCTNFDLSFKSSSKYLDFMFVCEDK